jgi:chromosomal replication initiator protein
MKAGIPTPHRPSGHALKRFIALPENRCALRAIRRLIRFENLPHPRRVHLPLLMLHGSPGTGKSHLVRGLMQRIICRHPDCTARLIAARDLARLLSENAADGEFQDCDLLIIEDIQHLPPTGSFGLSQLLDQRHAFRRLSVVTGSCGPAGLTQLSPRLTSRLAAGLVIGLESLTPASRRQLAKALCEQRGLHVADEVFDWLARSPSGGARPVIGDIIRLQRLSEIHAPPLDLNTVRSELPDENRAPVLESLAQRVADHHGLTCKQLKGRDRRRCLLWPRQLAMYLARKGTTFSLAQIGAFFGGYEHTTVLHACRKVERRLSADMSLPRELAELSARCC